MWRSVGILGLGALFLSGSAFGQGQKRLFAHVDKNGFLGFRVTTMPKSYSPPVNYESAFGSPAEDVISTIGKNKPRLEVSAQQLSELMKVYREFLRQDVGVHSSIMRVMEDDKTSKVEKEILKQEIKDNRRKSSIEYGKQFHEVLIPHQQELLLKIKFEKSVKRYGLVWALTHKPFSSQIHLKPDQIKAMNQHRADAENELIDAFSEFKDKLEKIKKKAMTKMIRELDGGQQRELKRMHDLPLEYPLQIQ